MNIFIKVLMGIIWVIALIVACAAVVIAAPFVLVIGGVYLLIKKLRSAEEEVSDSGTAGVFL